MAPIDRTPPYLQLAAELRKEITSGRLKDGDRLPAGRKLAKDKGVSETTASKALQALVNEHLAEVQTGIGTVVRVRRHSGARDRWTSVLTTGRIYPEGEYAKIRSAGRGAAPEWVAEYLGVEPGDEVVVRDRVTYNGTGPISMSTSYFAPELGDAVPALMETERIIGGTVGAIREATGRVPRRGHDRSTAADSTPEQAEALGIEPGSAVTITRNVVEDAEGEVIEVGESVSAGGRWVGTEYDLTPVS